MEIEYFVKPGEAEKCHHPGSTSGSAGSPTSACPRKPPPRQHDQEKLSHYAKRTVDIEYKYFTDRGSGSSMGSPTAPTSTSPTQRSSPARTARTSTRPPTSATSPTSSSQPLGATRALLAFLIDAYREEEAPNAKGGVDKRVVLRLHHQLAPIKVAVLPLTRNTRT